MTVETAEKRSSELQQIYEEVADDGFDQPRSVHTSVDAKIAYMPEEDEFGVVITETNAFPEGQEFCDSIHEEEWIENTVNSLINGMPSEADDVVVNLPEQPYQDDVQWLKDEKKELASRIESKLEHVDTTIGAEDLSIGQESVDLNGSEYDFVVNLSDFGDNLESSLESPEGNQNILNASTAVWNTNHLETGKAGLHNSVQTIIEGLGSENVYSPENHEIGNLKECVNVTERFFQKGESAILKGNYGTHGDEVVHLDYEEFEKMSSRFGIDTPDYVRHKVNEVEDRVKHKPSVDPSYSLFDQNGEFNGREDSSTAVIEQAVSETTELEEEQAAILDYDGKPLDLVYTVWDTGNEYRAGLTVRGSKKDDTINANCGSQNFDLVTYDDALENGVYQDGGGESLGNLLGELAGREVERDELTMLADDVAHISLGARNLSAYKAET